MPFRKIGERAAYDGGYVHVAVATFESPDGTVFEREVVRHRGAVGVAALTDDGSGYILVRQYRPTIDEELLEIPAGMCDVDHEPVEATAVRELEEECGRRPSSPLERLGDYWVAVGMTDELMTLFLCRSSTPCEARPQGIEEEAMEVVIVDRDEVPAMIADGRIRDAKTIIGLLLADRVLRGEQA